MDADRVTAVRGRYVFPIVGEPIDSGVVTMRGGTIVAIGDKSDVEPVDLGNVAILPGLVNAHTHLEFSHLDSPLGTPGEPLPTWIRRVIAARLADADAKRRAIARGIDESRAAGVTTIGEIATSAPVADAPPTMTTFHEVICLDRSRFESVLAQLEQYRATATSHSRAFGISPHAPYSVHPELLGPLCEMAKRHDCPVAMHLAESPEEMELLATGGGPFRVLLEELGAWRDDASPQGLRPLHYLRLLAEAPRALVVHGNYLADNEIAFAAKHRERMAVVYCPRTHAHFGHSPYPLAKLWSAGATVCLGTDSRASNPDLNLFEDMKFAATHHPAIPPEAILRMGTVNGARMLCGGSTFGVLTPGCRADLAIVKLPDRRAADPYELIFSDEAEAVGSGQ